MAIGLALTAPDVEIPVNPRLTHQPSLVVDDDACGPGSGGVGVYGLDPDLTVALGSSLQAGGLLQSILRVSVLRTGAPIDGDLPDVFGRYHVLQDGVRFIPHFPFERGVSYRASFDPRPLARSDLSEVLTLEFSLPKERNGLLLQVKRIFPSSDDLPENLLRFYVCFSNPMRRGRVETEIALLGPDGEPASDVLYRAPVELWDRSMRYLTVLLDPGRLKRGVGPNRKLGPPLKTGQAYTLKVGAGMTDISGGQLPATVYKRFRVTDAVREPIAVEQWKIVPPETNSRQPLVLNFPRPLDWALLSQAIAILSAEKHSIGGRIVIDQCERRWRFTPTFPWTAGAYHVHVASSLEGVCGNSVIAAFDRALRPGSDLAYEAATRSISFRLA